MTDKRKGPRGPAAGAASGPTRPDRPVVPSRKGFDPVALKGGKGAGRGRDTPGKRIPLPGKSRGR
ncbi:MAG: hypothetical protein JJT81_12165 [Rubellimicrobium sp.]|nr:hypothetical protein [Rubellimicrobium sp.]